MLHCIFYLLACFRFQQIQTAATPATTAKAICAFCIYTIWKDYLPKSQRKRRTKEMKQKKNKQQQHKDGKDQVRHFYWWDISCDFLSPFDWRAFCCCRCSVCVCLLLLTSLSTQTIDVTFTEWKKCTNQPNSYSSEFVFSSFLRACLTFCAVSAGDAFLLSFHIMHGSFVCRNKLFCNMWMTMKWAKVRAEEEENKSFTSTWQITESKKGRKKLPISSYFTHYWMITATNESQFRRRIIRILGPIVSSL